MLQTISVAIGIVHRDGKFLVARRHEHVACGGMWEFPGGKCAPDEPPARCVERELLEEMGIEVRPIRALAIIEHDYPAVRIRLHPYQCDLLRGEPAPITSLELRWVDAPELMRLQFPPANAKLIQYLCGLNGPLASPGTGSESVDQSPI